MSKTEYPALWMVAVDVLQIPAHFVEHWTPIMDEMEDEDLDEAEQEAAECSKDVLCLLNKDDGLESFMQNHPTGGLALELFAYTIENDYYYSESGHA